jgi:hypothetical protein
VTLTVRENGDDLAERTFLGAQRELWKRRQRGRGSVLDGVVGAVWSYEVKRERTPVSGTLTCMIALAEVEPSQERLSGRVTRSPGIASSWTCGPSLVIPEASCRCSSTP